MSGAGGSGRLRLFLQNDREERRPPNSNPSKVTRGVAKLEVRRESLKKKRSAEVQFPHSFWGNDAVDGVQEKLLSRANPSESNLEMPMESNLELPAGRTNMQLLSPRRPALGHDDDSVPILKIADISLGTPSGQEFAERTNFVLDDLLSPSRGSRLPGNHTPEKSMERPRQVLQESSHKIPCGPMRWPLNQAHPIGIKMPTAGRTHSTRQLKVLEMVEEDAEIEVMEEGAETEMVEEDVEALEICDLDKVMGEDHVGEYDDSKELFVMDNKIEDSLSSELSGCWDEGSIKPRAGLVGLEEVGKYGDKMREDSDSSVLCDGEEEYNDSLDSSDWDMDECRSLDSTSECDDPGELSDLENDDSKQFDELEEDESYHEETEETDGSEQINGSHEQMRGDRPEAAGHNPPEEKLPGPMTETYVKKNYALYGNLQILRGVVIDWACVNFSSLYVRLNCFLDKLAVVCEGTGMHFSGVPMKTFHVKSAIPNNIWRTFRGVHKSILELLSRIKMEGEPIGLLLVILPDNRDFDGKIEEACKSLGVVYQCCLPCDIYKPTKQYLKGTAREIKSKVVERDTYIPFVSEHPTIILGADTSVPSYASVATSVDWQEFKNYRAVVSSNSGNAIQDLSAMIFNLLESAPPCTVRKMKRDCRIILFRYGVNENQIRDVCNAELGAIQEAINFLGIGNPTYVPYVTYVMVCEEGDEEDTLDSDFFCNHGFVEGTKGARYRIISDSNFLTHDQLESIIIKLCLLRDRAAYPNISMVPPVHAARLQAKQVLDQAKTELGH